jgi:hypothetical protein
MIPTQRQIDLMDPKDRAQLPKKIRLTSSERKAAEAETRESQKHDDFISFLRRHKRVFAYVHANPAKPSRIRRGWPDFTVLCKVALGHRVKTAACLIEFKNPGGGLSRDQVECFNELSSAGIDVFVCTTHQDAVLQVLEYFELPNNLPDDKQ